MADHTQIANWLISHSKDLNMNVKRAQWAKEWLPEYSDIYVSIMVNGSIFEGHGIDQDENTAFVKAGVEALERAVCNECNIHSTGVAAHYGFELAKRNAKEELLERDCLLCHHLTNHPFYIDNTIENDLLLPMLNLRLKQHDTHIHCLRMKTPDDYFGYFAFATSSKYTAIVGIGYSASKKEAYHKAILECLPNVVHHLNSDNQKSLSIDEFSNKTLFAPKDHAELYLGISCKREFEAFVWQDHKNDGIDSDLFNPAISYEKLSSVQPVLKDVPLYFVRATSPDVQNIFYGPVKEELLNLKRLNHFKPNFTLNKFPHCIG